MSKTLLNEIMIRQYTENGVSRIEVGKTMNGIQAFPHRTQFQHMINDLATLVESTVVMVRLIEEHTGKKGQLMKSVYSHLEASFTDAAMDIHITEEFKQELEKHIS